jgi:hypothetical protein
MLIEEVSPEQFAETFHRHLHALARDFGSTDRRTSQAWGQVSPQERRRLIQAARLTLSELASASAAIADKDEQSESRRYFAKPGEAEWGC